MQTITLPFVPEFKEFGWVHPNEKPGGLAANVYKWVGNCSDTFFQLCFSQRLTFWQEL